ncbi:GspE/PulE family protein [Sulfurimonas autotrophica]|uniref:Type II secretion system protein E n=1 Tax=Sulfurimonas autotrophica (strain ATCC BAA-671 / DSM 16294 / JCM 11897 / OK10) TaxID=563040 RepID=E0UU07_SULAO|nr:GspE/PulE family protein [Sulfurimonas autotrophica]ADN08316.1 type II secretion system protein E [Sulfurimonas autotrophica DSM 16294]
MQKFEDILLAQNRCTKEDIEQAYSIRKEYGGQIGNILLNLGSISDIVYVEVLAKQYGFELYKNFHDEKKIISIDGIVSEYFVINNIFPIKEDESSLCVITHDPLQSSVLATIESAVKKQLTVYLATEEELRQVKELYERSDEEDDEDIFEDEVDKLKELASEAPVIKLVNNIFSKAVNAYVSDIHFESYKHGIKVRFRIDGVLQTVDTISNKLKQAVTARLKLISKMNISENRLPQDGRISIKISSQEIDIRSSSVPTAFGESFVLRFLGNDAIDLNIDNMGFHQDNLKLLKEMLKKPNGILLTTGPTGSGKTSTLYAALDYINSDAIKIITVEDPVEYQLDGISQIQVKANIDYTFANALRSILRQDPDVILIGEIRDTETAKIAIQSALTGHLVLSTLHTNSAIGAISRLLDMGMEYFLLKSSIVGLMAQRLARRLCKHCKEPIEITQAQKNAYNIEKLEQYIESAYHPCRAVGCKECNYTGYKGRMPIMEIIPFDDAVIKELDKNKDFKDIQKLGYRTLQDDAIIKFLEGAISLDEVARLV